jgi:hypothetical protein
LTSQVAWSQIAAAMNPGEIKPARPAVADTLAVVAVAFALRALFIQETLRETPVPGFDVDLHWQAARMLRAGAPVQLEWMMVSAPVHPLLIAAQQILFGESMLRLRLVSAASGALTWGLLHRAVLARTGSRAVSLITGLLAATVPALIYFDGTLFKTSFELTFLVAVVWLAGAAWRGLAPPRDWLAGCAAGTLLAALSLSQRNALALSVLVLVALLCAGPLPWRRRALLAGSATLVLSAALFFFSIRSSLTGPFKSACLPLGGIHLRVGLQPGATGYYTPVPGVPAWPYGHAFEARMLAEMEEGRALTPPLADAQVHFLA